MPRRCWLTCFRCSLTALVLRRRPTSCFRDNLMLSRWSVCDLLRFVAAFPSVALELFVHVSKFVGPSSTVRIIRCSACLATSLQKFNILQTFDFIEVFQLTHPLHVTSSFRCEHRMNGGELLRFLTAIDNARLWSANILRLYWSLNHQFQCHISVASLLWCCWFGGRKGIRHVKKLSGVVLVWLSV